MTVKFSQFTDGNEARVGDEVVGLRGTTNTRFDFPGAGIQDANGYYLVGWASVGGVVTNYVSFANAITGNDPTISVTGTDADVSLTVTTKNNGDINLDPAGSGYVYAIGTNAIIIPSGTTAQQPASPTGGLRYNTDDDLLEFWDAGALDWQSVGTAPGSATYITQTDETTDLPNSVPLSGLSTGIIAVTTGTGAIAGRTITGTASRISVANGDGSANPTIDIDAAYVGQATITTLGTITTGTWNGTAIGAVYGGTGLTSYTLGDIIYSSAANTLSALAGNITTAKQYLSQTGTGAVSAAPAWSAIDGGDVTGAALTKADDTNVTLTLGGTPATALLRAASITVGWTGQLALSRGGTNANLTADNGGLVYSDASGLAILASTATANQIPLSGSSSAPSWSTATYPATTTINQLLYSSAANTITGLATANDGVLITSAAGVPSISSTLPSAVQSNITTVGALTSGSLASGFTAVTVPLGGTGNTTFTAYSVICAGTTATGAFQNVSGLGTSGQVLTSNGAGALPTWQSSGAGSGDYVLISSSTASASSTVEFTGLSSTYFAYKIILTSVIPATDNVNFLMRTSADGISYDSGASDYSWTWQRATHSTSPSFTATGDNADAAINMTQGNGNATQEKISMEVTIFNPSASDYTDIFFYGRSSNNAGNQYTSYGCGVRLSAAAVQGVQFLMSSGNIASGEFKLYGILAS